ncbi:MAG: 4Fe-4S binding protein [Syntrophotaleaceae bacterium]
MKKLIIDEDFCKGCGLCVIACPLELITSGGQGKVNKQGYPLAQISDANQEKVYGMFGLVPACVLTVLFLYISPKRLI